MSSTRGATTSASCRKERSTPRGVGAEHGGVESRRAARLVFLFLLKLDPEQSDGEADGGDHSAGGGVGVVIEPVPLEPRDAGTREQHERDHCAQRGGFVD